MKKPLRIGTRSLDCGVPLRRRQKDGNRSVHKEAIFLQGKRSADDDAWYDCEVLVDKLEDSTIMEPQYILKVHFHGTEGSKSDIICQSREARSRLRPPHKLLDNGLCLQMQVGEVVLASKTGEKGPYYEARLQEIQRQRHSSRVSCKCNFRLAWMDKGMKGVTCTAPASHIRRIGQGSIEDFPMLSTWLQCKDNEESAQPETSDVDSDWESMLDREIERITNITEDFGIKEMCMEVPAGMAIPECRSLLTEHESRTKRGQHRIPRKGSKRIMASSRTVSRELTYQALNDTKPRLNPLAARAALASKIQMLSFNGFQKASNGKPLGEVLPCMGLENSAVLADKIDSETTTSKQKLSLEMRKRPNSFPECREKAIFHKLANDSLAASCSVAEPKSDTVSVTDSETIISTTEKEASTVKRSSLRSKGSSTAASDDGKMTTTLFPVGKLEQLTVKANCQGQTCKRAESPVDSGSTTKDETPVMKTRTNIVSSKNKPFAAKRPREIKVSKTEPLTEEKRSVAKESRKLITLPSNALDENNMVSRKTRLLSADKTQQISVKTCLQSRAGAINRVEGNVESVKCRHLKPPNICRVAQFVSTEEPCSPAWPTTKKVAAIIHPEKDSADEKLSKHSNAEENKTKFAQSTPLSAAIRQKEVTLDAVFKKEDHVSHSLKVSLGKKDVRNMQRTRGSKRKSGAQYGDGINKLKSETKNTAALELGQCKQASLSLKAEDQLILSCNAALHATSDLGTCSQQLPSSQQHFQSSVLKNSVQGVMELGEFEADVHLIVELNIDGHHTKQNLRPSSRRGRLAARADQHNGQK